MVTKDRRVIRVRTDVDAYIREFAAAKELEIGAAADRLIELAKGRIEALRAFGEKKKKLRRASDCSS